jgi:hypothetical protein
VQHTARQRKENGLSTRKIFADDGWDALWVDIFGGLEYRIDYPDGVVDVPQEQRMLPEGLMGKAGGRGGCWDVFAWRGPPLQNFVFAEAKRRGEDNFTKPRLQWLEAALSLGLPI